MSVVDELERYRQENPPNFGVFSGNFDRIYGALLELSEKPYLKARHIRERSGLDSGQVSPVIGVLTGAGMLEKWNDAENSPAVYRKLYDLEDLKRVRDYLSD